MRDTELTIWQQVERAYVTVQQAEEAIGAAQKAVESADENFRLSQGRFDAGVANIIELTDAQLALTTAQSNVAQALAATGSRSLSSTDSWAVGRNKQRQSVVSWP